MIIIPVTESAAVKMMVIDRYTYDFNGTLQIIGVLGAETVTIEQPKVASPDENTNADWTPIVTNGDAWVLDINNNASTIVGRMIIRVNKPISTGNAFGVSYI
jgi:hypothetical protein